MRVVELDLREAEIGVSGQEILMTDEVALRMNALVSYLINDARPVDRCNLGESGYLGICVGVPSALEFVWIP